MKISAKELFESDIEEPQWLVDKIIPARGLTMFAGEQSSSKSLIALHIAICVASGNPVLDNVSVKKGRVLYIDEENDDVTMRDRYVRMILGTSIPHDIDLDFFIFDNVKLDNRRQMADLDTYIKKMKPSLIICDSMVRLMDGDEDKAKDVRKVFDYIKNYKTSWLMLHHTGKSGNSIKSIRGSGDWVNMCHNVFKIKKLKGKHHFTFYQEKSRGATWVKGYQYNFEGGQHDPIVINCEGEKSKSVSLGNTISKSILTKLDNKPFKTGDLQYPVGIHIIRDALKILESDNKIKSIGHGVWVKVS